MPRPRKAAPVAETDAVRFDPEDIDDVDGDPAWEFKAKNLDKAGRKAVWVHNDPSDIAKYRALGFRAETYEEGPDAIRLMSDGEVAIGQTITARDHVLMTMDKAKYERREAARRSRNNQFRAHLRKQNGREYRMASQGDR